MPNIADAFPSNYLKASDLKGATVPVTIAKVTFEAVGREREMKAILYFAGKVKGVVLNKTNSKAVTQIAGSPLTEDWTGVVVALYPTETEFAGEMVECIRIKATVSQTSQTRRPPVSVAPPPLPEIQIHDDEIPF